MENHSVGLSVNCPSILWDGNISNCGRKCVQAKKYSQATFCRSIHDACRALCMIAHDHINFPPNLLQVSDVVI